MHYLTFSEVCTILKLLNKTQGQRECNDHKIEKRTLMENHSIKKYHTSKKFKNKYNLSIIVCQLVKGHAQFKHSSAMKSVKIVFCFYSI